MAIKYDHSSEMPYTPEILIRIFKEGRVKESDLYDIADNKVIRPRLDMLRSEGMFNVSREEKGHRYDVYELSDRGERYAMSWMIVKSAEKGQFDDRPDEAERLLRELVAMTGYAHLLEQEDEDRRSHSC